MKELSGACFVAGPDCGQRAVAQSSRFFLRGLNGKSTYPFALPGGCDTDPPKATAELGLGVSLVKMGPNKSHNLVTGENHAAPRFAVVEGGIRLLIGRGRDECFLAWHQLKRVRLQRRGGGEFFKPEGFHQSTLVGEGEEGECIFM